MKEKRTCGECENLTNRLTSFSENCTIGTCSRDGTVKREDSEMCKYMEEFLEIFPDEQVKKLVPKGFIEVSYDGSVQMVLISVSAIAYVDYSAKTRQAIIAINGTQYYEKNEYNPDCSVWHNKVYLNEPYEKVINLINEAQK